MRRTIYFEISQNCKLQLYRTKTVELGDVTAFSRRKFMWLPLAGFPPSGFRKLASLDSEKRIHPRKVGIAQAFDLESLFATFSGQVDSKWIPR